MGWRLSHSSGTVGTQAFARMHEFGLNLYQMCTKDGEIWYPYRRPLEALSNYSYLKISLISTPYFKFSSYLILSSNPNRSKKRRWQVSTDGHVNLFATT